MRREGYQVNHKRIHRGSTAEEAGALYRLYSSVYTGVVERHAVIDAMRAIYTALSARHLCTLTSAGRTWYYIHSSTIECAVHDVAPSEAIEQPVLASSGYGCRKVTSRLRDG